MQPTAPIRLRGLDLLRACAIVLVLMSHYSGFVAHAPVFGEFGKVGWAGVDLFFVLSGYLIGNQILVPVARHEAFSLTTFFARRFLRTLPNYYVVLLVYVLLPHSPIAGSSLPPLWRMLTFTQNIGLAYGQTFTHSWSLCIEEQFYVVLPLAVLALARWGSHLARPARLAWCVLAAAIGCGIAARAVAWLQYGHDAFTAEVYYVSFARFDELLPGVAIAMLRNFHPGVFARLQRRANLLFAAGLALSVGVLACIRQDWPSTGATTAFGFSLLAIGFAVLTLSALGPDCILNRVRVPGASRLALWSYAVYLAHKPVFMAIEPVAKRWHVDTHAAPAILAVMAAGVFAGWLLYRLVETPFMRLRARWYPAERGVERAAERPHVAAASIPVAEPAPANAR